MLFNFNYFYVVAELGLDLAHLLLVQVGDFEQMKCTLFWRI